MVPFGFGDGTKIVERHQISLGIQYGGVVQSLLDEQMGIISQGIIRLIHYFADNGIIEQDAPSVFGNSAFGTGKTTPENDGFKYCALNAEMYADLQKLVSLKQLPESVCVSERDLNKNAGTDAAGLINATDNVALNNIRKVCQVQVQSGEANIQDIQECLCNNASKYMNQDIFSYWSDSNGGKCECVSWDNTTYKFNYSTLTCEKNK